MWRSKERPRLGIFLWGNQHSNGIKSGGWMDSMEDSGDRAERRPSRGGGA